MSWHLTQGYEPDISPVKGVVIAAESAHLGCHEKEWLLRVAVAER